jgi:beta-phosphoglucomutase-like phosphatase (HAD superfamily)
MLIFYPNSLFDMDGTLIDSTAGVVGAWEIFAQSYPHIDVKDILRSSHGVRTTDNLRRFCGIDDAELLEVECHIFDVSF